MNKHLISVVIATHNRAAMLREAIASVRRQTVADWELIVVDDASEDETARVIKEFDDSRLRFFRLDKHGERAATRNLGLEMAQGEFIMFLDDDDLIRSDALQLLRTALLTNKDTVAAVGAQRTYLTAGYSVRFFHPRKFIKREIWHELIFGWSSVSGQNLYRIKTIRDCRGFADEFIPCEDRQLWLKISKCGPVCFVPPIVLEYRLHDGQNPRPANIKEIREAVYAEFIETLPIAGKHEASSIRVSARFAEQAEEARLRGKFRESCRLLIASFRANPQIWFSPLLRTGLYYRFKDAIFGKSD